MTRDEVAAQARKRLTPAGRATFDRWVAAGFADDVEVSGAICRWYIRWLQADVSKLSDEAGNRDDDNEMGFDIIYNGDLGTTTRRWRWERE